MLEGLPVDANLDFERGWADPIRPSTVRLSDFEPQLEAYYDAATGRFFDLRGRPQPVPAWIGDPADVVRGYPRSIDRALAAFAGALIGVVITGLAAAWLFLAEAGR